MWKIGKKLFFNVLYFRPIFNWSHVRLFSFVKKLHLNPRILNDNEITSYLLLSMIMSDIIRFSNGSGVVCTNSRIVAPNG